LPPPAISRSASSRTVRVVPAATQAGRSVTRSVELEFPRRGLYRESGFALSTRFPFGFLEKTLQLPVSRDLWVYPAVEPTEQLLSELWATQVNDLSMIAVASRQLRAMTDAGRAK